MSEKISPELPEKLRSTLQVPQNMKECSQKQKDFVYAFVHLNKNLTHAAIHAGFKDPQATSSKLMKLPHVRALVAKEREDFAVKNRMTKKKVMDGFIEAIDMAKIKADPIAMIAGWREIARMCGYFEPTRHQIQVSVAGKIVVEKLQTLSDADLLRLADGDSNVLDAEIIEPEDGPSV